MNTDNNKQNFSRSTQKALLIVTDKLHEMDALHSRLAVNTSL